MSEATVAQGVAETDQGDVLEGRLYVRDVKGMGLSTLELADTSTHLGKETNSKMSRVCICLSLMS